VFDDNDDDDDVDDNSSSRGRILILKISVELCVTATSGYILLVIGSRSGHRNRLFLMITKMRNSYPIQS